eukprot:COSAG01_NODE_40396_length_464_cov_0.849315_2_plen_100_part_00
MMRCQAIQLSTHMAVVVPGMPCQADRAGIALAATTAEHVKPYRRLDAVVVHKIRLSRSNKLIPVILAGLAAHPGRYYLLVIVNLSSACPVTVPRACCAG